MHVCIHTYTNANTHTDVHAHMHAYTHAFTHAHTQTHTRARARARRRTPHVAAHPPNATATLARLIPAAIHHTHSVTRAVAHVGLRLAQDGLRI